jgi:hypothetical protein
MRRNPLAILSVVGAIYLYYLLRGLGRALAAASMGLPTNRVMLYKVLPTFDVFSNAWEMSPSTIAVLLLAGPACALLAGYLLMALIDRLGESLPRPALLFLCITSYAGLMLDPIYYALIPLLRLGGEPDILTRALDIPRAWVVLPAMVILGLNVLLTRRRLVPLIRNGRAAQGET